MYMPTTNRAFQNQPVAPRGSLNPTPKGAQEKKGACGAGCGCGCGTKPGMPGDSFDGASRGPASRIGLGPVRPALPDVNFPLGLGNADPRWVQN